MRRSIARAFESRAARIGRRTCTTRVAMKKHRKRIKEQVIVVTGASSGIGLTTAEMAAARGAAVVLAARTRSEIDRAVDRIRRRGGRAVAVECDVASEEQV